MQDGQTLFLPPFVDKNPYNPATGYVTTNEEPELFNQLLGRKRFGKAACIASGGEMLFTVVAPRSSSVVAVDHSYYSLAAVFSKIILLQLVDPKMLVDLLLRHELQKFLDIVKDVWQYLPDVITKNQTSDGYVSCYDPSKMYNTNHIDLRREWCLFPERIYNAAKHFKKISLLHGDLKDLEGPFDLLYISNAMEHSNRDRRAPQLKDFAPLMKPNGLLLYTAGASYLKKTSERFEEVARVMGLRSCWSHVIARKKETKA